MDQHASSTLAILTGLYVVLTYLILRSSKKAFIESIRPYITIKTDIDPASRTVCLKISNTGKTSAENLRLSMNKVFCPIDIKRDENNNGKLVPYQRSALNDVYLFKKEIQTFPPGQEIIFYLGEASHIFKDDFREKTPLQFSITAEYNYQKSKKKEETVIDLEVYRLSQLEPLGRTIKTLQGIENAIRKLKK
ncbi:MAG: hypothetical protein JW806_04825 [Sedimentisphaerales bacterium]|nr:hypothetical protein [Sedimentisphaerales bacterium]